MLFLLSPAKSLVEGPAVTELPATQPALLAETEVLLATTRKLSEAQLQELMGISPKLAALNRERFQAVELPFTPANARQAALLFDGDVYKGLDAPSLSAEDLAWAQEHVGILSGLYGILRPLDLAQPYRLEMGTALKTRRGKDLYAFWGDRIAKQIGAWMAERGDEPIVNLASNEYFKAVPRKALKGRRVVTPQFKDVDESGQAKMISFFAKQARGAMTRWAIQHRVTDVEQLKACDALGYRFDAAASTADTWTYLRPKPPPVNT